MKEAKQTLLFLSQCFPLPLDGGGKIKTFNSLKTLSKEFDIFAVFVSERTATKKDLKILDDLGIKTKVFLASSMLENIKENYAKLAWNYLQFRPHYVYQYRHLPAFQFIKEKIQSWQPAIIHVDHINSSQFLPTERWLKKYCSPKPKLILENHNLDHRLFFTRLKQSKKLLRKIYLILEGSLNWLYGQKNYPRYDLIFSISAEETIYLKKQFPKKKVFTQDVVYDFPEVKRNDQKKAYDLIFVGHLEWPPNELAILYFAEEILPEIQRSLPEIKVHLLGKDNPRLEFLKNNPAFIFHGYKKNIERFLSKGRIFILPFQTGAGVRIKALTALHHQIPIVSTHLGVAGLDLKDAREVLLAKDAKEFAEKIVKLYKSDQLQKEIARNGKKYLQKKHGNKQNKEYLHRYLKEAKN